MHLLEILHSFRKVLPSMECFLKRQVVCCKVRIMSVSSDCFHLCNTQVSSLAHLNTSVCIATHMEKFSCICCHCPHPLMSFIVSHYLSTAVDCPAWTSSPQEVAASIVLLQSRTVSTTALPSAPFCSKLYSTLPHIPLPAQLSIPSHAALLLQNTLSVVSEPSFTHHSVFGGTARKGVWYSSVFDIFIKIPVLLF